MKHSIGFNIFVGSVIAAVVAVAVVGMVLMGAPSQERARRIDQQRVSDLQQITYAVESTYAQQKSLPSTIDDLQKRPNVYLQNVNDPDSRQPYEYRVTGERSYELCATYATDDSKDNPPNPMYGPYPTFWRHTSGRVCYALTVNVPPGVDPNAVPYGPPVKY